MYHGQASPGTSFFHAHQPWPAAAEPEIVPFRPEQSPSPQDEQQRQQRARSLQQLHHLQQQVQQLHQRQQSLTSQSSTSEIGPSSPHQTPPGRADAWSLASSPPALPRHAQQAHRPGEHQQHALPAKGASFGSAEAGAPQPGSLLNGASQLTPVHGAHVTGTRVLLCVAGASADAYALLGAVQVAVKGLPTQVHLSVCSDGAQLLAQLSDLQKAASVAPVRASGPDLVLVLLQPAVLVGDPSLTQRLRAQSAAAVVVLLPGTPQMVAAFGANDCLALPLRCEDMLLAILKWQARATLGRSSSASAAAAAMPPPLPPAVAAGRSPSGGGGASVSSDAAETTMASMLEQVQRLRSQSSRRALSSGGANASPHALGAASSPPPAVADFPRPPDFPAPAPGTPAFCLPPPLYLPQEGPGGTVGLTHNTLALHSAFEASQTSASPWRPSPSSRPISRANSFVSIADSGKRYRPPCRNRTVGDSGGGGWELGRTTSNADSYDSSPMPSPRGAGPDSPLLVQRSQRSSTSPGDLLAAAAVGAPLALAAGPRLSHHLSRRSLLLDGGGEGGSTSPSPMSPLAGSSRLRLTVVAAAAAEGAACAAAASPPVPPSTTVESAAHAAAASPPAPAPGATGVGGDARPSATPALDVPALRAAVLAADDIVAQAKDRGSQPASASGGAAALRAGGTEASGAGGPAVARNGEGRNSGAGGAQGGAPARTCLPVHCASRGGCVDGDESGSCAGAGSAASSSSSSSGRSSRSGSSQDEPDGLAGGPAEVLRDAVLRMRQHVESREPRGGSALAAAPGATGALSQPAAALVDRGTAGVSAPQEPARNHSLMMASSSSSSAAQSVLPGQQGRDEGGRRAPAAATAAATAAVAAAVASALAAAAEDEALLLAAFERRMGISGGGRAGDPGCWSPQHASTLSADGGMPPSADSLNSPRLLEAGTMAAGSGWVEDGEATCTPSSLCVSPRKQQEQEQGGAGNAPAASFAPLLVLCAQPGATPSPSARERRAARLLLGSHPIELALADFAL